MKEALDVIFCKLLRVALGLSTDFPNALTEQEWQSLFTIAQQQAVLSVVYNAFPQLPEQSRPPRQLRLLYAAFVESRRGLNVQMNQDAARYTQLFNERGFRSIILKGQANARLYPDPLSRQAGDIDIWVLGDSNKVNHLLFEKGFISEDAVTSKKKRHINFRNENGTDIEVHYWPTEIPFRNRDFQKILLAEAKNSTLTPEGFYTPSIRFALIMQLQHLYRHCVKVGVGLRHYMDYFMLTKHSTEADREFAWKEIKRFGLGKTCAGVMWVLGKAFELPCEQMLCTPDKRRGIRLYKSAFEEGNFGRSASRNQDDLSKFRRWINTRLHTLQWLDFGPMYIVSIEIQYWKNAFSAICKRIRRKKIGL